MTHLNYDQLPITLVALSEQTPVGMASLRINDGIRPDLEPWLGSLVVHPKYRGSRVGERLIKAIEQEALARGYEKLYLLAFDATIPNWYSRLGWKKMGTDELFTHTVTVMQLELEK
ncbi:MAG: GNAT family N-acetyltransferase [Gammaproteobacteria bacterium]|nr:GNAT family N-acetyltransferase [Gammaproteobacteria bacterium]